VLADSKMTVQYIDDTGPVRDTASDRRGYPPPLRADVMQPLQRLVATFWPNIEVVPTMSTGASDGVFTSALGLPTYNLTGQRLNATTNARTAAMNVSVSNHSIAAMNSAN
jgi:acetylornithine deacetylase/succinyl-diaminopimelate desuccinylase-like protein